MDNKQIIIDGVNVRECYQYMHRHMEDYDIDTLNYCRYHFKPCKDVDVKYCYYKQFKRKEQECEELKKIIQRHDNDNNALLKEVEDKLCEYYRRYRECITDIKEIAEKDFNHTCWETYARQLKQILQRISECKGEYNEKIR